MALRTVVTFFRMIKFSHTLFALPFALMGAVVAAGGVPAARDLLWLLVAMGGARTGAMALNRYVDAEIDALNPRTRERAIPAGLLTRGQALVSASIGIGALLVAAHMLRPFLLWLTPVPVAVFVVYPFTKRFTRLSHFILGFALAMAPAGAYLAIRGTLHAGILLVVVAVVVWVAGFDILYALQDVAFDRAHDLKSVPERFGVAVSIAMARALHGLAIVALVAAGFVLRLGWLYAAGLAVVTALFVYEHLLVRPDDLRRLDTAFFAMNGYISITVFAFTLADVLVSRP